MSAVAPLETTTILAANHAGTAERPLARPGYGELAVPSRRPLTRWARSITQCADTITCRNGGQQCRFPLSCPRNRATQVLLSYHSIIPPPLLFLLRQTAFRHAFLRSSAPGGPCTRACFDPAAGAMAAGAHVGVGKAAWRSHSRAFRRSLDGSTAGKISRSPPSSDPPVAAPPAGGSRVVPLLSACRRHAGTSAVAAASGCTAAKRKSVPSRHIACMMTASLRATAVTARLWPRCRASFIPHALRLVHTLLRVSRQLAAS